MRAVQQPQLHLLEGPDVAHHLDAEFLPAGPARRKSRPRSPTAGTARSSPARRPRRLAPPRRGRDLHRWSPARCDRPCCDGQDTPFRHVPGEISVSKRGELREQTMQGRAVRRKVVAGEDSERPRSRRTPPRQRLDEEAVRRLRHRRVCEVGDDARMRGVLDRRPALRKYAFSVIVSVTMRTPGSVRASSSLPGSSRRHQHLCDRADDTQLLAIAAAFGERIEPVLRLQALQRSMRSAATRRRCPSPFRRPTRQSST